jgi:hypothetical protein
VRELLPINWTQTWVEEYAAKYRPEQLPEVEAAVSWLRLANPQRNNQLLRLLIIELDYFTYAAAKSWVANFKQANSYFNLKISSGCVRRQTAGLERICWQNPSAAHQELISQHIWQLHSVKIIQINFLLLDFEVPCSVECVSTEEFFAVSRCQDKSALPTAQNLERLFAFEFYHSGLSNVLEQIACESPSTAALATYINSSRDNILKERAKTIFELELNICRLLWPKELPNLDSLYTAAV